MKWTLCIITESKKILFQLTLISNNVWLYWPCHFPGSVSIIKKNHKIKIEFIVQSKSKYWHKYVVNVIKNFVSRHLKLFVHKAYYVYRASAKMNLMLRHVKVEKKCSQIIRCLLSVWKHAKKIRKMCLSSLCKREKNRSHGNTLKMS